MEDNSSDTTNRNLLGQIHSLEKDLTIQQTHIDTLETDLQNLNQRQAATEATASKAQYEARTSKAQLHAAEKNHDQEMRSLIAKYDKEVTAGDAIKRKFHELAERRTADRNEIAGLRLRAEQDSLQFEAGKRSLERKTHGVEEGLKKLVEEVERERAQFAVEVDAARMTRRQLQEQEGDYCPNCNTRMVTSPALSIGIPNTTSLAGELGFDFWDGRNTEREDTDFDWGGSDTDTNMEFGKQPIETRDHCHKGVQTDFSDQPREKPDSSFNRADFSDQPGEKPESDVDSVGLDIMGKLDELALICTKLKLRTVKIQRSADWMVVMFP